MARETFTREIFWAELDELGEEEVRTRVSTGTYSSGNRKRELAQQWLDKNDQERNDASSRAQMDLAREANAAARDAATSAQTANKIATAALAMAIISMVIALVR